MCSHFRPFIATIQIFLCLTTTHGRHQVPGRNHEWRWYLLLQWVCLHILNRCATRASPLISRGLSKKFSLISMRRRRAGPAYEIIRPFAYQILLNSIMFKHCSSHGLNLSQMIPDLVIFLKFGRMKLHAHHINSYSGMYWKFKIVRKIYCTFFRMSVLCISHIRPAMYLIRFLNRFPHKPTVPNV